LQTVEQFSDSDGGEGVDDVDMEQGEDMPQVMLDPKVHKVELIKQEGLELLK
jgi:hypothetical protein